MKIGFVVCSRLESERVPRKVLRMLNGKPLLWHLLTRLSQCNLPVVLAVPSGSEFEYSQFLDIKNVSIYSDENASNPLARMFNAAKMARLDAVIRVTHDKIFVDKSDVKGMLKFFKEHRLDYCFSTSLIPGTGFEMIKTWALEEAHKKFKDIEFIGFAIKQVTNNYANFVASDVNKNGKRLLIDFQEDLQLVELILSSLGNGCSKADACDFLDKNQEFLQINANPLVTVYTCAFNAEAWIDQAMASVKMQDQFKKIEYILIDDFSSDSTFEKMMRFSVQHRNVKAIRNEKNIGLSSSSNKALKMARGKYIVRLDADDYFTRLDALKLLTLEIEKQGKDVIYPDNYFGTVKQIQSGDEKHHVGGTLFHRDAVRHLQFTEGLRHHDSLDIFIKAQSSLNIGYLKKPVFLYRQHDKSMSKTSHKQRRMIANRLLAESKRREFANRN